MMTKKEQQFVETVWTYYKKSGRHTLPWRQTQDPYLILVSELMLQQTQVVRVIPKYEAFVKKWPTVQALAVASLGDVLIAWQGLGYNRRAKFLQQCAQAIVQNYQGVFPDTRAELETLPGIGPYTAGAVLAFAYNQSVVLIETNVRRVYIHHFFPTQDKVSDTDIRAFLEKTLPAEKSREWYSALMDYGTFLKKTVSNPNQRSKCYVKQSVFQGSDREIRGAIIKALIIRQLSASQLQRELGQFEGVRIRKQADALLAEGLILLKNNVYVLHN